MSLAISEQAGADPDRQSRLSRGGDAALPGALGRRRLRCGALAFRGLAQRYCAAHGVIGLVVAAELLQGVAQIVEEIRVLRSLARLQGLAQACRRELELLLLQAHQADGSVR